MRSRPPLLSSFVLVLCLWAAPSIVHAAEIKVLSAGAMKSVVSDCAEAFRQETGHAVAISMGTAGEIRQKMTAGDPADVVLVSDTVIEQLATTGTVVADTRSDIARTGIGVAARDGTALPDISTPEALKHALLPARSTADQEPPTSGTARTPPAVGLQPL